VLEERSVGQSLLARPFGQLLSIASHLFCCSFPILLACLSESPEMTLQALDKGQPRRKISAKVVVGVEQGQVLDSSRQTARRGLAFRAGRWWAEAESTNANRTIAESSQLNQSLPNDTALRLDRPVLRRGIARVASAFFAAMSLGQEGMPWAYLALLGLQHTGFLAETEFGCSSSSTPCILCQRMHPTIR
jgi:hypothetical protein